MPPAAHNNSAQLTTTCPVIWIDVTRSMNAASPIMAINDTRPITLLGSRKKVRAPDLTMFPSRITQRGRRPCARITSRLVSAPATSHRPSAIVMITTAITQLWPVDHLRTSSPEATSALFSPSACMLETVKPRKAHNTMRVTMAAPPRDAVLSCVTAVPIHSMTEAKAAMATLTATAQASASTADTSSEAAAIANRPIEPTPAHTTVVVTASGMIWTTARVMRPRGAVASSMRRSFDTKSKASIITLISEQISA